MPRDLASWLQAQNHCIPKLCYHNCFLAVMRNLFDTSSSLLNKIGLWRRTAPIYSLQYVLGWTTHKTDGIRTPHALIKLNDKYYDPTIEPQGHLDDSTFELEKEFTSDELLALLKSNFSHKQIVAMKQGEMAWTPLRCTSPGVYEFTDE